MVNTNTPESKKRMGIIIVMAYPLVILLVSIFINVYVLGINTGVVGLPSLAGMKALVIAAALLLVNHTWIMTSTELVRARFMLFATPEEREASTSKQDEVSEPGTIELDRRHAVHRNTSENVIYFVFLAILFSLSSPTDLTLHVWLLGYPISRLGYTYSYFTRNTGLRGLFMTLGLLAMYGMASNLFISIVL